MTTVFLNGARTKCCYTSKHRNPLRAPRKELDCSHYKVAYHPYTGEYVGVDTCPKKPFNTIYKDNYAVSCTSCDPSVNAVCYNPVIRKIQNRNGYINDKYNYSAGHYLQRRCRTYEQQAFNFISNLALDAPFLMTKKWSYPTDGGVQSSPAVSRDGAVVYVGSYDKNLYAINAADGTEKGATNVEKVWSSRPAISSDGEVIYVGSWGDQPPKMGGLYATHASGGKKWSFTVNKAGKPVYVFSSPAISHDGTKIYMGSLYSGVADGLYAINAANGTEMWSNNAAAPAFSSVAVSHDGAVIYVGGDYNFHAIHAADGTEKWSFPGFEVFSSPAISHDGAVIYVGSNDNNLYAINAAHGMLIWSYTTGGQVESSPAVSHDGSVIYVGSDDKSLYAINAADGTKKWSYATGGAISWSSPAVSPDGTIVYVGSMDYNLYAIDARTGKKLGSFKTGGSVLSSPTLSPDGKTVYVGSMDNSLYAINVGVNCCGTSFATQCHGDPVATPVAECMVNCDNCETVACRGYSKCAVKNANCCAVYKRSNGPFSHQGAVSGGSRINRLKYQTILKSQSTYKVPNPVNPPANNKENAYGSINSSSNVNAINGEMPVTLYRDTIPTYKRHLGGFCALSRKPPTLISMGRCRTRGTLCCFG